MQEWKRRDVLRHSGITRAASRIFRHHGVGIEHRRAKRYRRTEQLGVFEGELQGAHTSHGPSLNSVAVSIEPSSFLSRQLKAYHFMNFHSRN
jgi:hypothetical protein